MVIIHDHACSTTVKLNGIYDSTKMSRSSSTTTPEIDCVTRAERSSAAARALLLFESED